MGRTVIYTDIGTDLEDYKKEKLKLDVPAHGVIYRFKDAHDWTNIECMGMTLSDIFKNPIGGEQNIFYVSEKGQMMSDHMYTGDSADFPGLIKSGEHTIRAQALYMIIPNTQETIDPRTGKVTENINPVCEKIRKNTATATEIKNSVRPLGGMILAEHYKTLAYIERGDNNIVLTDDEIKNVYNTYQSEQDQSRSSIWLRKVLKAQGIRDERASEIVYNFVDSGEAYEYAEKHASLERRSSELEPYDYEEWSGRYWIPVMEQYIADKQIVPDEKDIEAMKAMEAEFKGKSETDKAYQIPWYHDIDVYVSDDRLILADEKDNMSCSFRKTDDGASWEKIMTDAAACDRLSDLYMGNPYKDRDTDGNAICLGTVREVHKAMSGHAMVSLSNELDDLQKCVTLAKEAQKGKDNER